MARLEQIPKSEPTFNDLMIMAQNNTMARTNCHNVGRIIEFDKDKQTCTVQIMQLKQFFDKTMATAPITDVPLIIYGMGDGFITLPNPVGSVCLLFFMDRNIDAFLETGELYEPDNTRLHDFSDCIAITTFSTLNNPIENYDDTSITVAYKKIVDEVLYSAVIKNFGNSIQLKVSTQENTTQINISDKVNIQNTSQSLATLIQDLITEIKAITVNTTSGAVMPTSQDNLDAIASKFTELLQ